jgi:hypothetical protein
MILEARKSKIKGPHLVRFLGCIIPWLKGKSAYVKEEVRAAGVAL